MKNEMDVQIKYVFVMTFLVRVRMIELFRGDFFVV
jgi:hypothetical protein